MEKKRLLITDRVDEEGLPALDKFFTVKKQYGISSGDLKREIATYAAIITRSPTGITEELLQQATHLKIIGRAAIGVDNIDIQAATRHGVAVINAPKGNARSTAEHTIGMMLALLRHIPQAHADLKQGIWGKQKYVGTQAYGKTLGIVGYGNVGKEVYRLAHGIGMKVNVCEPYIRLPKQVKKMTFESLMATSDIITFHVPATYLTRRMINKQTLALCRPGTFLINCSRGAVVDEDAVLDALDTNRLAGFAVDVYQKEPQVSPRLLSSPKVVATPHIAGSTTESQRESVLEVVSGILQYMDGTPPSNLLNPQVFHKKVRQRSASRGFDTIIFDCDSTLCDIEGVDELAAMNGKKKPVAALTRQAMDGSRSFEDVYRERMAIIHPSQAQVERLGQLYIDHLVPDAKHTIAALQSLGKNVYIISSGYWSALAILARYLAIPEANVFGNDLLFDARGRYLDIMEGPLIRNHGKLQIIRQLSGKKLLIGDAVTDGECREVVDLFVGYGGVIQRPAVKKYSDLYLTCPSLAPALILAAGLSGTIELLKTPYRKYVGKGVDLLFHPKHAIIAPAWQKQLEELKTLAYY